LLRLLLLDDEAKLFGLYFKPHSHFNKLLALAPKKLQFCILLEDLFIGSLKLFLLGF